MKSFPPSKILLVDDADSNIDVLVDTLGNYYDLSIATSGEQALKIVSSDPPDLILLDIIMPGIDGYEVCRRLKSVENTANIPIIFVTVKTDIEDEQKGLDYGAIDYITKPFSPPIVKARVKNHLLIKHQKDQLERSITLLQHEKELLQQKADIGIQAGCLAHDMANGLSGASMIKLMPRTRPMNSEEWQEMLGYIDDSIISINMGSEICHGFTNYLKDIGEEAEVLSIKEFLPSINIYAKQFHGELIREINNEIPYVKCKGYQIKRVLANLFVNAIQALENQKDPKITIRVWGEHGHAFISIKDNGAGISSKIMPNIFKECYTTKTEGTGLGLYLTKQIIDAHGGKVEVVSEEKRGAEFIISLPAYQS